jgi:hypothetical protein
MEGDENKMENWPELARTEQKESVSPIVKR